MTGPHATDVARSWGMSCPACGDCDEIDIAATVWVRLCPDGTDPTLAANGDHEWDDDHAACCNACGFHGTASEFSVPKVARELRRAALSKAAGTTSTTNKEQSND